MAVFRIRVVDVPRQCFGVTEIDLFLQTKEGYAPGATIDGDMAFEAPFEWRADRSGVPQPSGGNVHRESDGRRFVYLSWLGLVNGDRKMFRRLKVYFDQGVRGGEDVDVNIQGRDKKGNPSCARAVVV